jgi:septum formation topological specificity factor MinE
MTVNRERKLVKREIGELDVDYCTAVDIIDVLKNYIQSHGESVKLYMEDRAYSDYKYISVTVMALEDDYQYAARIIQEEHIAAEQEKRDRATFERLQRKYECP